MKKPTLVHPLMSEAFVIWLISIGYRGVTNASWASLDAGSADEWWDVYEEVMKAAQEPTND